MLDQTLTQILILLAAAVLVVGLVRRAGWPPILGYLLVGMALGPHALALLPASSIGADLGDIGVAFLLFTLGLEFSLPRMMAVRREVFGLGSLQVGATVAVIAVAARACGLPWLSGVLVGGAMAMSSTAIILHTLTDRAEINRTHGRLAFSMLLFQDLAFVPFLVLASAAGSGGAAGFSFEQIAAAVGGATLSVAAVLATGRWLLRPLFHVIAHSRVRELFTLTVLLVVLASSWASHVAGLSLALGAFLAGMMLAETEYRHQIESVIRPFRDLLLGLFFISVGMLLDLQLLLREFVLISGLLVGLLLSKALVTALVTRLFTSTFKAVRTAVVMAVGGEFGVALLTLALRGGALPEGIAQPLLVALVLSMVISPLILTYNSRIARLVLRERRPVPAVPPPPEDDPTGTIAQRDHVILCGYGRVGQSVARTLTAQGIEYIAIDLDPARIRAAREAGEPALYGDSSDEDLLQRAGMGHASAVVVSFSSPGVSLDIVRTVRQLRPDVPVVVRTVDEKRMQDLKSAGASEVLIGTFELGLVLASQALAVLKVPAPRIEQVIMDIRADRYALLRGVHLRTDGLPGGDDLGQRQQTKSVVIPPGAWAVGRSVDEVLARGAVVTFTGIRRHGILGHAPEGATRFREGDIVVTCGEPAALEHAEGVLLAG